MLQSILVLAIPTLVTLSAAFFVLRSVQKNGECRRGGPRMPQNGSRGDGDVGSSTRRRRPHLVDYDTECAVCFDRKPLVKLYPCNHKNFCADCINIILEKSKRMCPLCRKEIKGYEDAL